MINSRQLIAIQQIKALFATNGITLTIIHLKISINLFITFQKLFQNYLPNNRQKQINKLLIYTCTVQSPKKVDTDV